MTSEEPSDFLLIEEVARLARTTPGNIHYMRSVGKGPRGHKRGVRLMFRREDVEAWLNDLPLATTRSDTPSAER